MYKYLYIIALTFTVALLSWSCRSNEEKKIVLIHSFEKSRENYAIFNEVLVKTLKKQRINPQIYPFYLDGLHPYQNGTLNTDSVNASRMLQFLDSIQKIQPDIVLLNDDQAYHAFLNCKHPFTKEIPVVFAGVNYPNWALHKQYPNMTGFHDKHDFIKNIKFINTLMGQVSIKINCDNLHEDEHLYDFLEQIRSDSSIVLIHFTTFLQQHPELFPKKDWDYLNKIVEITSDGEKGGKDFSPGELAHVYTVPFRTLPGFHLLRNTIGQMLNFCYLEINHDMLSDALCQQVGNPSFSAHNEPVQYSPTNSRNRYIGGYFTSLEIQAKEQARTAARILNGTPVSQIPVQESEKEYILVWHGIQTHGLSLDKIPNYVRLVNVPFYEQHKKKIILFVCIAFIVCCVIATRYWYMFNREEKHKKKAQEDLVKKNNDLEKTLKKLEKALEKAKEADMMKSAFLANMSHEIRTPLNAIVGFSNLLNTETDIELEPEERENFVELINTNSELLLNLINDILDLSRIESGRMSFVFETCSLNELMNEIYQTYLVLVPANVELRLDIPDETLMVSIDKHRLTQVVNNFINNAIKFTREGYILIGYHCEQPHQVHIFVEDTGIGIPKEKLGSIFERFTKLDEFAKGSGLGLSICKIIAERFGGHVDVESEVGKGSRFSIFFPIIADLKDNNSG